MTISCKADHDHRLFRITYTGVVTLSDITNFVDDFEPEFMGYPNYSELCDVRGITDLQVTPVEARALFAMIASIYRKLSPKRRVCYVHGHTLARPIVEAFCIRMKAAVPTMQATAVATEEEGLQVLLGLPSVSRSGAA